MKRYLASLLANLKYKGLRKRQICIYKGGSLTIENSARFEINDCYLFINRLHYKKSKYVRASYIWVQKNGELIFKSNHFSLCEGSSIHVRENAKLHIEGKGFINTNTEIDVYESISIGEGTIISSDCYITDSDQHTIIVDGEKKAKTKGITIGKRVWIGRGVTILKGVHIGDDVIIGASSVVTKSIPNGCMFAGNPAKLIRENVTWEF